jgi:hypothetical protein
VNNNAYAKPLLIVHGNVKEITQGSRIAFSDAWFGAVGNDGVVGPKCSPDSDVLACTADGS